MITVPTQRILRGRPAVISAAFTDQDGSTVTPRGPVTVRVTDSAGVDVLPAGTATSRGPSVAITAAQLPDLDLLTATWTDADSRAVVVTTADVAGGYWFSISEARDSDPALTSEAKYPDALLAKTRREVEDEAERIIGAAFVPRFRQTSVWSTGLDRLMLPNLAVRRLRSLSWRDMTLTDDEMALLLLEDSGLLVRPPDFPLRRSFPKKTRVAVAYEHGLDAPPSDLKEAALLRLRHRITAKASGIPDRATSFAIAEGGTYSLAVPGEDRTGIPDVDAVYGAYRSRYGRAPRVA